MKRSIFTRVCRPALPAVLDVAVPGLPTVASLRAEWRDADAAARNRRRTVYLQRKAQTAAR